tara:strand:+ start:54395 stop:55183 length:789 start_codon:yes stop_codon:yes gene_type:complete
MSNVKSKIMGLLNISADDAASEAEIETALRLAKKMMERHHLSEDDLVDSPEDQVRAAQDAEKTDFASPVGKKIYRWEKSLSTFVRDLVGGIGCYTARHQTAKTPAGFPIRDEDGNEIRTGAIHFYGITEDVYAACEIYSELRTAIVALARIRYGSVFKGSGGLYAEGFVAGLRSKLETEEDQAKIEAVETSNSNALVLIERRNALVAAKTASADLWLQHTAGVKLSNRGIGQGASGSHGAFTAGRTDGAGYNVGRTRNRKLN